MFDLQALYLGTGVVATHADESAIDYIVDAGNGNGSFGDVGGENDAAGVSGFENALLIAHAESAMKG